jgi:uncharacterized protein (TIGR03435 family)
MTRKLGLIVLFVSAAFGQPAAFEAADVRAMHVNLSNFNVFMSGPIVRSGRYEIRTGTMLDLISTAYGMDQNKVVGGPTWLEMDRFDVIAKLPAGSTAENRKLMLQALLADRFKLAVHNDSVPMAAYALTALKHRELKEPDGSGEKGCKVDIQRITKEPPAAGAEAPPPVPTVVYTCRNVTMEAFADDMRNGIVQNFIHDQPILDQTGLKGSWDFGFKFTLRGRPGATNAADNVTVFDALEKQLGLKLELVKTPLPVVVVDSVNQKPTENAPDIEKILPGAAVPTEFDVADVQPTPSDFKGTRFNIQPGGRVNLQGVTLQLLVQQAWGISPDMIVGAPKWFNDDRFDVVAKAPSAALDQSGPRGPNLDWSDVMTMVKNLLSDRFKMVSHMEERSISAYTLLAAKPKMRPADPNGRIKCEEGPGADGKDPRDANPVLGRLITCQNMSMTKFAEMLMGLAPGYIHAPVLDATGLEGTFDFTLSFSMAGQLQSGGGRGGDGPVAGAQPQASDPNGALSLLDALPKQLGLKLESSKRPVEVLVIDRVEQKPTDN